MANESTSDETMVKGTGLMSSANWIRKTYGEATFKEIVRSLSPAAVESLTSPSAAGWYPAAHISEIWRALERVAHPNDPASLARALRDQGHYIASDNLSTVFRVLLALIGSPEQMFQSSDRLWGQYFKGVRVEKDDSELQAKRGTTMIYGLAGVHHIAPVACGWTEAGYGKVGARNIKVHEEAYEQGETTAEPLVFVLSWQ